MTAWDIALITVVTVMGTVVAYLKHPERKAFVLMLPLPFTLAVLSLGRPVDATNVLAIAPSFGFTFFVWMLYSRLGVPILVSIILCAAAYCAVGMVMVRFIPASETVFWLSAVLIVLCALVLTRALPYRIEPHYRTLLPVWIKLPAIALVVTFLVLAKEQLGGFMTMFPMVGVIAAYEARHSLWTLVRRFSWIALLAVPLMSTVRLTQNMVGLPMALVLGWALFLSLLWLLRKQYHREVRQ